MGWTTLLDNPGGVAAMNGPTAWGLGAREHLLVVLSPVSETKRRLTLTAAGARYATLLARSGRRRSVSGNKGPLLAIDTSTLTASVALAQEGVALAEVVAGGGARRPAPYSARSIICSRSADSARRSDMVGWRPAPARSTACASA